MRVPVALLILFFAVSSFAGEKNCRLVAQTWMTNGKKVVEVTEEFAATYTQCKLLAKQREIDSENDRKIVDTKVIYAFRKPSVVVEEDESFLYDE